jgi:hypothetical protein
MNEKLIFFSQAQGNLLIRLLLAHLAADFMLQTTGMVMQKKWFSKQMLAHISIVFALTAILGCNLLLALCIAITHWVIDGLKIELAEREIISPTRLFVADQLLHIVTIIILWAFFTHSAGALVQATWAPFSNYKWSLILLGYVIITTPVSYLIQHATSGMNRAVQQNPQRGGKWIGIFERIIIITFVLLAQYPAIGFLITGKSIIRFANNDEHLRSEYVLVGTMMSYALAILTGVGINCLLAGNTV